MRAVRTEDVRQPNARAQKRYRERQKKKSSDMTQQLEAMQGELSKKLLLANHVAGDGAP